MLIIGYGNPLRDDDGVGWRVSEAAAAALSEATVIMAHQLTPDLAEPLSRCRTVVFIDAAAEGIAGEVRCLPLAPNAELHPGSHESTPESLMSLAADLYGHCPQGYIVTIAGESFGFGESLSAAAEAAVPAAVREVVALARRA